MKKLTVMLLIAAMVLGVSACGNSANKGNTATESQMSTQEAEDLDAKINELTQKENSIPVSYTHLTLPTNTSV